MSNDVRFVLADDHEAILSGVHAWIEKVEGWTVVGEATNGLVALDLATRLKPDVLVLDFNLPGLGSLEVTRRIRRQSPKTWVVFYSAVEEDRNALEALRCGASAYVFKSQRPLPLVPAIRNVLDGKPFLSPPLSLASLQLLQWQLDQTSEHERLSPREREILLLAALGKDRTEIAEQMGVSLRTVDSHRSSVSNKLGLQTRTELARFAQSCQEHDPEAN